VPAVKEVEIFEAAARIFKQKGYHATSMQDIADAVGLQKGSLYHYLSSKEDLLFRISERAIEAINARLADIRDTPVAPAEKLRAAIENHVQVLASNLDLLAVFLQEGHRLTREQQARLFQERQRYEDIFADILQEGIAAGQFRRLDVRVASYGILGMINWMHQWYQTSGRLSPSEIADLFVDLVLNGLRAPATPRLFTAEAEKAQRET
jgi:AcrR family transcriptional regulator